MLDRPRVAVIGLGASGLVTLKNLAEEGFDVTGFERSTSIGGVWNYDESTTRTTALKSTYANGSKYRLCFTDFPFSPDTPAFPEAAQVNQYLEDYASHFNLHSRIETSTDIERITRNHGKKIWELQLRSNVSPTASVTREFDKVVLATGLNNLPVIPDIKGIEKFGGAVIHSQQFKSPGDFQGKRILVVGLNNSAGDTATALLGIADKIYLSHRGGAIFLKRWLNNKTIDHDISWFRLQVMQKYMDYVPGFYNWSIRQVQNKCHQLRPEWNLNNDLPPFTQCLPLLNDDIVDAMHEEKIVPVANITTVLDQQAVLLGDGTKLSEIDAIIFCTGYKPSFSVLGDYEPEFSQPYRSPRHPKENTKQLPKLYQNIFSLDYPDSLAYVCGVGFQMPVFHVYDLASMALAQVWKGAVSLPPVEEMRAEVEKHYQWILSRARLGSVSTDLVRTPDWYVWANEAAGTKVYQNLGYGVAGWKFWLQDRTFCNALMYGINSPHKYRLFDSPRRKKWDGAKAEILRVVKEIAEMS
ncbi:uncharacterized protein N7496_009320 [Penicillium cataractarum]|uniref:Dimethylaniline monooxygenase 2 n=1 Tax=Penicillium cataractarum TaxID=2100454 RepID=A0A9W9RNU0_9EURO|nr:uncharacterized protein N7496_009320 [Penicillium cataractarum]KAJ5363607.1 hypothetical protein N7496_009320 [Penicillium cataractarum]